MAGISLGGVNLDVSGIVSQLMDLESAPLAKLQKKNSGYNSQLSELGRLNSVLSTFQSSMQGLSSLDKFEIYKFTTSELDAGTDQSFSATIDANATAGIYSIDVQNLAVANKIGSASAFASQDTAITSAATGTLDITDDGGVTNLNIDINGKTLIEIRDEINTSATTNSVGVSASIITQSAGNYQLVLSATETGLANDVQVSSGGDTLTHLNNLAETQAALDASVLVDGYTLTSASNEITDAISGVTLNLLAETGATAASLSVTRDTAAVATSVSDFVSSYNALNASIKVYKDGALKGDSSLNTIQNLMRNSLNTSADLTSSYNYLSEVGVTTNAKTGELELDSTVLNKAIATDYQAISELFATTDKGVAFRMESLVDGFLKYDGLIKTREEGINARIKTNTSSETRLEYRLQLLEAKYLKQYSALDSLIGQMNSTSNSLAGQLASLPGFTR